MPGTETLPGTTAGTEILPEAGMSVLPVTVSESTQPLATDTATLPATPEEIILSFETEIPTFPALTEERMLPECMQGTPALSDNSENESALDGHSVSEGDLADNADSFFQTSGGENSGLSAESLVEDGESLPENDTTGEAASPVIFAEDDIAHGQDNDITWVIDASGKLTVSGSGDFSFLPPSQNPNLWKDFATKITSAEINVTGMTNAAYLFYGCSNLQTLELTFFDTSSVTDMGGMFAYCRSLAELDLSSFITSNVTNMRWMFFGCESLAELDLSSFDTSSVTSMWAMFLGCESLAELDLSSFITSNVTDMSYMFQECSSLTELDLSSFDTSNVTSMSWMFAYCSNLTELDLSSFVTSYVADIYSMFLQCNSLQTLNLSSFNLVNAAPEADVLDSWNDIFSDCTALTTLYSPYNIQTPIPLPSVPGSVWELPDGTEITELSGIPDQSIMVTRHALNPDITTTTPDLNMDDVIRVKYVPYSYTIETNNADPDNTVTFSLESGRLADGLQLYPTTGEIYGVPLEAGTFPITVKATYSNPAFLPSYADLTLIVLENTNGNIASASDPGYEIIQYVPNLDTASLPANGSQLMVSRGEYIEFLDLYLDGQKLTANDYDSESGSTRITILNQTLTRNGSGTHTLSAEFRTQDTGVLRRSAQNYAVSDNSTPGGNDRPGDNNGGNSKPGDNTSGNNKPGHDTGGNISSSVQPEDNTGNSTDSAPGGDNGRDNGNANGNIFIHFVRPYDTLWTIAARYYGSGLYWRKVFADNADRIRNPHIIYTGQPIIIYLSQTGDTAVGTRQADAASKGSYAIQPGDSLWKISAKVFGTWKYWESIYRLNQNAIRDPRRIYPGQLLVLPNNPVSGYSW